MVYSLEDIEKELLPIVLDVDQLNCLKTMFEFVDSKKLTLSISGKAGCGKTFIIRLFLQTLDWNFKSYITIAPTHKAKNILSNFTGAESITIHQLLSLRPNLNILELDFKDLQFVSSKDNSLNRNQVWIIDECSMVNNVIYDQIIKKAKEYNCKIIFIGDIKQLAPINQDNYSKTFNSDINIFLTKVYRQKNSYLEKILIRLREKPIFNFEKLNSIEDNLEVHGNFLSCINSCLPKFKDAVENHDPSLIKCISYTNKRISRINTIIRTLLYGKDPEKYVVNDILTGYSSLGGISNSVDYIVVSAKSIVTKLDGLNNDFFAWDLTLKDSLSGAIFKTLLIQEDNIIDSLKSLASEIERRRLRAIRSKRSADWVCYFKLTDSFILDADLCLNDRIVKSKTIDYGYCITAHKSQSGEYDSIFIDMENILSCIGKETLRQLQYVALSRVKNKIYLYQKYDTN